MLTTFEKFILPQYDHDQYDELSAGLQWFEGKKEKEKSKKSGRRKQKPSRKQGDDDRIGGFPIGLGGGDEKEDDFEVMEKLQVGVMLFVVVLFIMCC